MEQIPLSTLTNGLTFTADLFIDNSFLILPQTLYSTETFLGTLFLKSPNISEQIIKATAIIKILHFSK